MAKTPAITRKTMDIVIAGISDGIPLRQLARMHGFSKSRWYQILAADEALAGRFARAREEGFDAIAEEALEIADDGTNDWKTREKESGETYEALNHEHVQRSKLRVETRLKLLAKWDPKRYGEKIDLTSSDGSMTPKGLGDFYGQKPE
jgi:hypothetical protein